jgi:serine/threonine protein kinase
MTPERFRIVGEIYDQVLELEPERRDAYLTEACAGDGELRREVESLLAAHESARGFIDQPAVEIAADLFANTTPESFEGKTIGTYQVLLLLGKGGMGEVYLAHDLKLRRKVAIKVLPQQFLRDAMRVKMFEREARAASALNHPNIITIFDIGQFDGAHFIATEFIEGQTVRLRLKAAVMPLREAMDVAVQTASALAAAHEAGIVHRDIKPENVMVRRDGYVKVLDFGLAKLTETPATNRDDLEAVTKGTAYTLPGVVMGTAAYMSPEQARGEVVDSRSDIFSLGVLIYEMVAGKTPFAGATVIEVLAATLEREPLPLTEFNQQIPAELERIVAKSLRKDRRKRYQTIRDMLVDLEGLKQQLDLESAGAGFFRRSGKKAALLQSVAVLVMVIAVVGAIFFSKAFRPSVAPERVALPERALTYHLIAQRDPQRFPDSQPFPSTGEHIFEAWYQARLMISSGQAGYLYVLNEGPPDQVSNLANYVLLFPDADTSYWSAAISANRTVQIPQPSERPEVDWIQFDKERGTEKFWLVWSERSVPELEAVKHLANTTEAGAISNPDQIIPIAQYLARHYANKPEVVKDEEQKLITFKAKGETLVALIRIEHQ